jgi:mRNA interferase MazF
MRAIHLVQLTKTRPALLLTREVAAGFLTAVVIAPITSTIRGIATEVHVGIANGLDHDSVVSLDNVTLVPRSALGRVVGYLLPDQEDDLARAVRAAFGLVPWA